MIQTNKIHQGDCLEIMKGIPDESISLIMIDPPYKITSNGSHGTMGGIAKDFKKGKLFTHADIDITDYIDELYRVLKQDSHCYIMTNNKNLHHFLNAVEQSKFKLFKTLIWKKNAPISNMYYMDQHEYILFMRKGKAKKINHCGTKSVIEIPNVKNRIHPTEKPVELLKLLIGNSTNESTPENPEIVLDCFSGSGALSIACLELNRHFICIEKDEEYYKKSVKRLDDYLSPR